MNRIEFIKYGTLGIGAILTGCTIEEIEECPPQPISGSMSINGLVGDKVVSSDYVTKESTSKTEATYKDT